VLIEYVMWLRLHNVPVKPVGERNDQPVRGFTLDCLKHALIALEKVLRALWSALNVEGD